MKVYHGTDEDSAKNLIKNIQVKKGGGELGRGFYTGENIALAAALAFGKFGPSGKVLSLDINDHHFAGLNIRVLTKRKVVYEHWKHLIFKKESHHFTFGQDVICGPFATIEFSYQYKFESEKSEDVLNDHSIKEILGT